MTPTLVGVPINPDTARELSRAAKQLHSFTRRRDEYVLKARAEGGSLRDIAKLAGITHRAVAKIIERYTR